MLRVHAASKLKLQRQLDRAWAANLVERVEGAAAEISVVEAFGEDLVRDAETGISEEVQRWPKVGVVQDVEHLCAKLERHTFVDRETSMYGEVPQKLSPYNPKIKLLKVDKANFDRNGNPHQLFGTGYSAKRYCLRTEKEIIKPSEHGLGPYFVPAYKDDERFWKPSDCSKDDVYLRWVKELWEVLLGMRTKLPQWADFRAMRKYAVTTPNILKNLRRLDRDAAKPYSFCIVPIASFGGDTKVAAYCEDPERYTCGKAKATAEPGEIILFVRPLTWWEKLKT